jgi:lysophospholipase L1-like esterase
MRGAKLKVRYSAAVAAVMIFAALVSPSLASAKSGGSKRRSQVKTRYYLALGDSLSQGMQPDPSGLTLNTNQGYTDQLFQIERRRIRNLKLVKIGCGGDTTGSLLTGKGNEAAAKFLHCDRKGGSQMRAAELFLKAHHRRGEVPLITIDIGANNIDGCPSAPNLAQCLSDGEAAIKHDLPIILGRLGRAAPKGTTFAGMTLYNPVLGGYFSSIPSAKALASASPAILKQINDLLTQADDGAGFLTADVAGAFASYDSTDQVSFDGQMIPINVARVCSWTWACTTPPSGPNIHANKNGYAVIARALGAVIGKLT